MALRLGSRGIATGAFRQRGIPTILHVEMVVCCSGNVCYVSLKGHIAIECHSQISGVRVGVTDSYTFGNMVLVC